MEDFDLDAELAKAKALNRELHSILHQQAAAGAVVPGPSRGNPSPHDPQPPPHTPLAPFSQPFVPGEHPHVAMDIAANSIGLQNHLILSDHIHEFGSFAYPPVGEASGAAPLPPIQEGASLHGGAPPPPLETAEKPSPGHVAPLPMQPGASTQQRRPDGGKSGKEQMGEHVGAGHRGGGRMWDVRPGAEQGQRGKRPQGKPHLTFSAAPHVPKARPNHRTNYSHSPGRLIEIEQENKHLVQRLQRIGGASSRSSSAGRSKSATPVASGRQSNAAPAYPPTRGPFHAAVLRKQQASQVAIENLRLYQRLQQVRPSVEVRQRSHQEFEMKHETYRKLRQLHQ